MSDGYTASGILIQQDDRTPYKGTAIVLAAASDCADIEEGSVIFYEEGDQEMLTLHDGETLYFLSRDSVILDFTIEES